MSRRDFAAIAAMACAVVALPFPARAYADDDASALAAQVEVRKQVLQMREELSADSDAYYKALEAHDAAAAAAANMQSQIDTNTAQIETLQSQLSDRMKDMYKNGDLTLLDVMSGSATFEELSTQMDMLDRLNSADAALVSQTKDLRERNESQKVQLDEQEAIAQQKLDEAKEIKDRAQAAADQLQALYDSLSATSKELVEQEQADALASSDWDIDYIGNPRGIEPNTDVVSYALSRLGCPYVWAAAGPDTFDCSGLVSWCYAQTGVGLPHYTESLYALALSSGAVLKLADVEPGDVLYRPGHVGIAVGAGGVPYIHAPNTGSLVRDTDTLAWSKFVCGLRFPK